MFIKNKRSGSTTLTTRSGFTLVEIMIVVAIIALLAAIGIPSLLNARRTANDSAAFANLKSVATELETYVAQDANGLYPVKADLAAVNGISNRLCADDAGGSTANAGFDFTCTLATDQYTIVATPSACGTTGSKTYTITTGAVSAVAVCT